MARRGARSHPAVDQRTSDAANACMLAAFSTPPVDPAGGGYDALLPGEIQLVTVDGYCRNSERQAATG